jgi:hypothetical protein
MAEFIESRQFFEFPEGFKAIKITGLAKLRNVTHDGTCGYRCIAGQDGVPPDDIIQRFINLATHPDYATSEVTFKFCIMML